MSAEENKKTVERMWRALSEMDWEKMKSCMHPEIYYRDVYSEDGGARGPDNCIKRLLIAFDHLQNHEQETHHIVAEGDVVFLDHTEKWTFKSGETAQQTFCTMHEIKDGLIYRWSDYWDLNRFVSQFPQWFIEEMMKAIESDFSG